MVWFRHKGCTSPLVEYRGTVPLVAGTVMKQAEWFDVDGELAPTRFVACPDCKGKVLICCGRLVECKSPVGRGQKKKTNEQVRRELGFDLLENNRSR